jgi:nucleoside-diphosphate-sugar epimerase
MRLFVTGATGFIGSNFVNASVTAGHEVVALTRSSSSKPRVPTDERVQWVVGDLDQVGTEKFIGIDVLVHLAAHSANVPYDTLENCLYWNVTASLKLFRNASKAGVKRFVVAGTCFEYGRSAERYEFIPVHAPLEPTQSYPASKAAATSVFQAFASETACQLSLHRIFQVYGPGELESRLWPSLQRHALNGLDMPMTPAEQVRDFIHVNVVCKKFLEACDVSPAKPGCASLQNLGSGHPQTVRAFSEHWWKHWQAKGNLLFGALPYRTGEVMRYVPQID